MLKASQKGDKLEDVFNAVKLAESYGEYNGTEVKEACSKVLDLVKEDGTAKASKKSGVVIFHWKRSDFYLTNIFFEIMY